MFIFLMGTVPIVCILEWSSTNAIDNCVEGSGGNEIIPFADFDIGPDVSIRSYSYVLYSFPLRLHRGFQYHRHFGLIFVKSLPPPP